MQTPLTESLQNGPVVGGELLRVDVLLHHALPLLLAVRQIPLVRQSNDAFLAWLKKRSAKNT
jgi:hypothetical protein